MDARQCPHVAGFRCPMIPGLECPELPGHTAPGSAEAAYCRIEARRAGRAVPEPGEHPPKRYRK